MRLIGKVLLRKIKKKNSGNQKLCKAIDKLILDLELFNPDKEDLYFIRQDADCVHSDGFYFFNISVHRTLVLVEFDNQGEATIVWAGSHQEYESVFKNNKKTIEKWLRSKNYID
ncbi:type II toxin-antitoxin system HigB family toxin [Myroides marinus]|uniref:type II toxin-antitoxin system HigB family toxin n=1 Tax=Myroides marinus TaxID=703342 RepID=UPI0025762302|nr:type II toxin-antitoxin system HigB family toxin [Myroides marinus]MDM1503126.1 type II toxin-antitoxin system HigB family toxin [Myroides marinus]